MSNFFRILKVIGRALWRGLCAIGRFFKFLVKRIVKASKTSRLNKRIAKNEDAIQKLFSEIGENYYEAHADAPEPLLSDLCSDVNANKTFIAEAQDKIAALQEAYNEARQAAKDKAKARRAADKETAKAEKRAVKGIAEAVEDVSADSPEEPAFAVSPDVSEKTANAFQELIHKPAAAAEEDIPADEIIQAPVIPVPQADIEEPVISASSDESAGTEDTDAVEETPEPKITEAEDPDAPEEAESPAAETTAEIADAVPGSEEPEPVPPEPVDAAAEVVDDAADAPEAEITDTADAPEEEISVNEPAADKETGFIPEVEETVPAE